MPVETRTPAARNGGTTSPPPRRHPPESFQRAKSTIHFQPAEALYDLWPTPVCIVADGPYGLSGFPGDLHTATGLVDWYRPHVAAWTARSTPETTLWFWNSELGWATVHPLLAEHGWEYRSCHIWDKGLGHIAGNANTRTLRKFPVTTEVCAQYVKAPRFRKDSGNFGRLVRYGVMDDYIAQMQSTLVRGIAVRDWQSFFKAHLS